MRRLVRDPRAQALALILWVFAFSGHRFVNDFVFDDVHVIEDGELIHDPSRLSAVWTQHTMVASAADPGAVQSVDTYRPVPLTLFMLDAALWDRNPVGYHLTNLSLHVLCVLLVWLIGRRWLGEEQTLWAAYGAALFAALPWCVEAHVWINGRSDPLALLGGLTAMLALLEAERRRSERLRHTLLAFAAVLAGMLSKETLLMCVPAIVLMPAAAGTSGPLRRRWLARGVPLIAASAIYLAMRIAALGSMATHRDGDMALEAIARLPLLLLDALWRTAVPSWPYLRSLRDEYASVSSTQLALSGLLIVCVLSLSFLRYRRGMREGSVDTGTTVSRPQSLLSWAALWFVLPLAPVAVVSTVLWPGFGRYLYLPSAGFAWAVAALLGTYGSRLRERLPVLGVVPWLYLASCGVGAALYTADFRDSDTLYRASIAARPDVAMGYGWLGFSKLRTGDIADAVALFARATSLDPETHRYLAAEGRARLAAGDIAGAAAVARRGIARFRGQPAESAYRLLSVNTMTRRDPELAVGHLLRCLEVYPGRPDCLAALRHLVRVGADSELHREALMRLTEERPGLRARVLEIPDPQEP